MTHIAKVGVITSSTSIAIMAENESTKQGLVLLQALLRFEELYTRNDKYYDPSTDVEHLRVKVGESPLGIQLNKRSVDYARQMMDAFHGGTPIRKSPSKSPSQIKSQLESVVEAAMNTFL